MKERKHYMNYKNTWDMEGVFAVGSDSPEFHEKISNLQEKLKEFDRLVNDWNSQEDAPDYKQLEIILSERETIEKGIGENRTFISAVSGKDVDETTSRT